MGGGPINKKDVLQKVNVYDLKIYKFLYRVLPRMHPTLHTFQPLHLDYLLRQIRSASPLTFAVLHSVSSVLHLPHIQLTWWWWFLFISLLRLLLLIPTIIVILVISVLIFIFGTLIFEFFSIFSSSPPPSLPLSSSRCVRKLRNGHFNGL